MSALPEGYVLRHTTPGDIEATQALLDEVESAQAGEPRRREFEVRIACDDPRVDLATNTWVVEAPGGDLVGFAFLFWGDSAQGEAEPFVCPGRRGRGIGDALIDAIERRATELAASAPAGVATRLHVFCAESKARRRRSLLDRGYRAVRESYLMRIDLPGAAGEPAPLPAGIDLRPFVPGRDDEAVYAADEEAFADHFLFESSTLAQWRLRTVEHPAFDPSLWLVAWAGDEVAGEELTFLDEYEAYVDSLAVRRRWRGRGLGFALLTSAFALARQHGRPKVRLGVDAQNATGALALYLKAGMHVERREEVYAKELVR